MLHKVVQILQSLDETLVCGHLNESYCFVSSCGTVYYAVQLGSKFGWALVHDHSNSNESYWEVLSRGTLKKNQSFKSVERIPT